MTTTKTAAEEISELQGQAEKMKNDAPRTFDAWQCGDVAAQGDLNIVCIGQLPKSAKPRANRQLADGQTMGSRHVVEGGRVFDADADELVGLVKAATGQDVQARYMGPVFTGPATLTHPEHGHHVYPHECINVVVYQRVLDAEEREQRARD